MYFPAEQRGKISFKFLICGFILIIAAGGFWSFWPASEKGKGPVKNSTGTVINLPVIYSEPLVVASFNKILSIAPVNAAESQAVALPDKSVIYYNAYNQTDVQQVKHPTKLKESLILKAVGHPDKFEYQINIDDYLWEIAKNGDILFKQKEKEERYEIKETKSNYVKAVMNTDYTDGHPVLFKIPKPFLVEAQGDKNDQGAVEVKIEGNTLTLRPDINWLKTHTYPIILDPTVETIPREQESIVFGDENSPEFKPKMKLNKWGDETFASVEYESPALGEMGQQKIVGDKVVWEDQAGKISFEFYEKEPEVIKEEKQGQEKKYPINNDGGVEFNVILKEKPATNQINFKLESQGLEFYYQAPTKEMPEYVIGSYAVYHAEKTGDFTQLGGKNYRAGKAFQIYRPRLEDATGKWVWGELNIDVQKGKLTVTIPQDFLDQAVYPIRQAAGLNFGYSTVGTAGSTGVSQDGALATTGTPVSNGLVTSITTWVDSSEESEYIKGVIWLAADGTVITNGVGGTVQLTGWHDYEWMTMTYATSPTVTASTAYYVGFVSDCYQTFVMYDSGVGGGGWDGVNNYATPATLVFDGSDRKHTIYATYTPTHTGIDPVWNSSWRYRRLITIDNSEWPENLVNFPLAVHLNSSRIDYSKTQDLGQDIRFVDADNTTELNYEIENWNEAATSTIWVKVPQIESASSTDHIWMYYGNDGASDNSTTTGVWDENYMMVQHMNETSGVHDDSTRNNNDSNNIEVTTQGSATGRLDGADDLNGTDHGVQVGDHATLDITSAITLEAWVRDDTLNRMRIMNKKSEIYVIRDDGNGRLHGYFIAGAVYYAAMSGNSAITQSVMQYTVFTWNSAADSGTLRLYANGSEVGSYTDQDTYTGALDISASDLYIGNNGNDDELWDGIIDELRISNSRRSAYWIRASFKSMSDTFVTFDVEEENNSAPTVSSVADSPDPIGVGSAVNFILDWNDADTGEYVVGVICKGSGITTSTATCKDGEWTRNPGYTNRDPENLITYTTVAADKGNTRNYWAFVCDDGNLCSSGTAGTFAVSNQRPDEPISLLVEGMEIGPAINLTDATPEFSFVYKDFPDQGDLADKYCVEVDTQSDFAGDQMWATDSANCYTGTAIGSNVAESARSPDLSYDGTAITLDGTTYYWRAWFWDDDGERSATSTTGWFKMASSASGGGVRLEGGRLKGNVRLK